MTLYVQGVSVLRACMFEQNPDLKAEMPSGRLMGRRFTFALSTTIKSANGVDSN